MFHSWYGVTVRCCILFRKRKRYSSYSQGKLARLTILVGLKWIYLEYFMKRKNLPPRGPHRSFKGQIEVHFIVPLFLRQVREENKNIAKGKKLKTKKMKNVLRCRKKRERKTPRCSLKYHLSS